MKTIELAVQTIIAKRGVLMMQLVTTAASSIHGAISKDDRNFVIGSMRRAEDALREAADMTLEIRKALEPDV